MAKVLNFNVAALALIGSNVQVRVREKDGVTQVRPSARVISTNLPAGETMRKLSFKQENGKVNGARVTVTDLAGLDAGTAYELINGKYGWYTLAAVAGTPAKGSAFGRVAAK